MRVVKFGIVFGVLGIYYILVSLIALSLGLMLEPVRWLRRRFRR